tara:strand:- start:233 stop:1666 length:1434 start_codon:yes stop_codon:yes gene_type:complete
MSSLQIPDVLRNGPIAYQGDMHIDTQVLDPLVSTDTFSRFVLPSIGFLDTGSVITFSVKVAANDVGFFPVKTGCAAAISSCILKVGNKVVCITDQYGKYSTIRRAFHTPEEKGQKDMVHMGSTDNLCPNNGGTGEYQLRDVDYNTDLNPALMVTADIMPQFRLTTSSTDCPVWSIKLSEMFPALRNLTLPLFAIDQDCSIEIVWNKQETGELGKVACFDAAYTANAQNDTSATVDSYNVKFLADYITYDEARMNATLEVVMSDDGWNTAYEDVVSVSTNFQAIAQPAVPTNDRVNRDLGFSGMRLRSILGHFHKASQNDTLLGHYSSDAYQYPSQYNIRVNDKLVYPQDLDSESQKASQLSQVFGTSICCGNSEYSLDSIVEKDVAARTYSNPMIVAATVQGLPQQDLQGSMNFMGCDFNIDGLPDERNGISVGFKPVQVLTNLTNTALDYGGREVTYFGLVERYLTIRQGEVHVSA